MKFAKYIKIILLIGIFASQSVWAESFSATADKTNAKIGERVCVVLKAEAAGRVIFPEIADSLSGCTLISKSLVDTAKTAGKTSLSQKIYLTSFESGAVQVPSFTFLVDKGNSLVPHYTKAISINFSSPDIAGMKDIKPAQNIISEAKNWRDYWLWYVIAGGVILLGLLIASYIKRRKKKPAEIEVPKREIPKISPEEWLSGEIASLRNRKLWLCDDHKSHFSSLADAVKRYLELKYNSEVMELTTDEIKSKDFPALEPAKKLLVIELLSEADLVKFAKLKPEEAVCLAALKKAEQLI